jgi:ATP-dependent Lon protease
MEMIIKSKNRLPIVTSDSETVYPVLPLMTGVLFPGTVLTIQIGREENLKLIEACCDGDREFVTSYSHSEVDTPGHQPLHQVGVFAKVHGIKEGMGGSKIATLEGLRRAALTRIIETTPYLTASAYPLQIPPFVSRNIKKKVTEVISIIGEITHLDPIYSPELSNVLKMSESDPYLLADRVTASFHFSLAAKQELLETISLEQRFEKLLYHLNGELSRVATVLSINENVKKRIEDEQQKYFLRQQLHEIRRQLGEDFTEEKEAARLRNIVKTRTELPSDVVARARIEIDRLSQLSPASAEYGVTKGYLEWLLNLPWGKCTAENYNMAETERIISSDYYGPTTLKEQVFERLSIRKLLGGEDEGSTLCLVGAPGTGKASLARAIARALGKEFIRISVGGISDVAEIKGTPRTFLGAYPGKIIRTLRDAGTCDPLILVEDIDYFNVDNSASVNMALLEVIDSRRNSNFLDNYLGIPFDLSGVLFVCSVRSFEELPEQFVPRLELLELPGYIEREKIVIGKRYIIPKLIKRHGIAKSQFKISDKVLLKIITNYTQEAGLLGFSQQIEKVCRKIALQKAEKKKSSWTLTEKNIELYLGTPVYIPEKAELQPEIGSAAGLAWTGSGGELMFIEGLKMKGEGGIATTGSLGEVMRESIQAAHSYVRSKADMLGIDSNDFNAFDIHIHFPSGAIPKDGPSAGITVCLVIASVMAERPIRNDIAMTGEVTLRGKVLAVGGIKEKVSAAYRAGLYNVVVPKENEKDLKDLPREIIRKTKFTFIERVDELFELCLLDMTPSTHTLEKIFAEEIEKAKRKKRRTASGKSKVAAKPRQKRQS